MLFIALGVSISSFLIRGVLVEQSHVTDTFEFSSSDNTALFESEVSAYDEISLIFFEERKMTVETVQSTPKDTTDTLLKKLSIDGYENRDILQELWVRAADGNITEETLLVFKNVKDESSDPELSSFASMVLKDLKRLQKIRSGELSEEVTSNNTLDYTQLEEQLLSSNEAIRNEAVTQLGNDRNTIAIPLLKAHLNDSSTQIRLNIVQSLWRMAADGFDAEHDLTYTLQEMTTDEDEAVAQAAVLAVEDLIHLQNIDN